METLVSQPIEEAVNTVDGIDQLRSVSGQGNSFVMATFNLNRDIDTAAQDVRDRVASIVRDLPPDVRPPVIAKFNNDSSPVLTISLSGQRSIRELTEYGDKGDSPATGARRGRRRGGRGRRTAARDQCLDRL